jgi:hypothetical protein
MGCARHDTRKRCDDNDPVQRRLAKQREWKLHYPIPVL